MRIVTVHSRMPDEAVLGRVGEALVQANRRAATAHDSQDEGARYLLAQAHPSARDLRGDRSDPPNRRSLA